MNFRGAEYDDASLEWFNTGDLREGTLSEDAVVGGVLLKGGRDVVYYPGGQLKMGSIANEGELRGVVCAAGLTYLYPNGRVWNCTVGADPADGGLALLRVGSRVTFSEEREVLEYSSELDGDAVVDGFPCSSRFPVWRYGEGQLSCCVLSESAVVEGVDRPEWTELRFARSGGVLDAVQLSVEPGWSYNRRIDGAIEVSW